MAATVSIKEVNGADAGTPNPVTTPRLCTTDSYNPLATYPLVKPAAGNNYSYWKHFYLNASAVISQRGDDARHLGYLLADGDIASAG